MLYSTWLGGLFIVNVTKSYLCQKKWYRLYMCILEHLHNVVTVIDMCISFPSNMYIFAVVCTFPTYVNKQKSES